MKLRARLKSRVADWARSRQGIDQLPLTLRARRIYILPTRAGLGLALLLLLMLAAGLNYNNNLALLITFTLVGYAIVGMHECHRTLKNLRVVHAEARDCFAGEPGRLELRFENPTAGARRAMRARFEAGSARYFDLPGRSVNGVMVEFYTATRGLQPLPRIELSTTAPLGLFCAWSWLHLDIAAIVYPRPGGLRPLPTAGGRRDTASAHTPRGGDEEWSALRPYAAGDSPRSVAWKRYARGGSLMVSLYQGVSGEWRELGFETLGMLSLEARLSQLTQWVLECEQRSENYRLSVPGSEQEFGRGSEQQRQALRMLALYGYSP